MPYWKKRDGVKMNSDFCNVHKQPFSPIAPCPDCFIELKAKVKALELAICPDGSITDLKELLEFSEDLQDAFDKLGDLDIVYNKVDTLEEKVKSLEARLKRSMETNQQLINKIDFLMRFNEDKNETNQSSLF